MIGPGFLEHFADLVAADLPTNIRASRSFVRTFFARPPAVDDLETLLCSSMVVAAVIRASLAARQLDYDDVLRAIDVPVLITHGRADTVVLPAAAEHVLATCPTSEAAWYEGVGHVPFLEEPERFNRELAELARRAHLASPR